LKQFQNNEIVLTLLSVTVGGGGGAEQIEIEEETDSKLPHSFLIPNLA